MTAIRSTQWVAVAVVVIMVGSSLGLLGTFGAPGHSGSSGAASVTATTTSTAGTSSLGSAAKSANDLSSTSGNAAQEAGDRALAAAKADGISPNTVFVPRPSASAEQVAAAAANGSVTPLYSSAPAPNGLGEFGLNDTGGNVTPFILNTTSVQATFDPSANGGPNATDLADSSPDGYGVQLNAVAVNVTLFGNDSYSFWTQDVFEYFPYSGLLYIVSNVWNFSNPSSYLSPNVFYKTSVMPGCVDQQVGTDYYYSECGPYQISYPFDVTFNEVSGITDGRNSVDFSLVFAAPDGQVLINATDYDQVIFNSVAHGGSRLTTPANYQANGYSYNPLGLTDDFELTIGGPGGGSQTTFLSANATETLDYWDSATKSYEAVPSAYSYGGETGETSTGVAMSWATGANGQPYGIMSEGASLLGGLWNASSPAGGPGEIDLSISPSNAFVLLAFENPGAFNTTSIEVAPTITTGVLTVPAGSYAYVVGLSGYQDVLGVIDVTPGAATPLVLDLVQNASWGVYTPLWAWSNSQIANLATSGDGTIGSPYVLVNDQPAALAEVFGQLNDYAFPVWPGVYFLGTTAYTDFNSPPSLTVDTSEYAPALPATNQLPYWFYDDSNIAITNASGISGWFSGYAYDYPYFLTFNVEFWNSTNTLIYNDSFDTQAQALLLYSGSTASNPDAIGNATIWGNTFTQETVVATYPTVPYGYGVGLDEQENGDLVYNNYFATPTTAVSYPTDLYYGYFTLYYDTWNVTPQAASNVLTDANWPAFPLTGTIIPTVNGLQGGNFWWDYGNSVSPYSFYSALTGLPPSFYPNSNPYSVLPYTETGWIYQVTGDFAPLLSYALYNVTLVPLGLPPGTPYSISITNSTSGEIYYEGIAEGNVSGLLPASGVGTPFTLVAGATGYATIDENLTVSGNETVTLTFVPAYTVTFTERGLAAGTHWSITIGTQTLTSSTTTLQVALINGTYSYTVGAVAGYTANPASGTLTVSGQALTVRTIFLAIPVAKYAVTFTETGLPTGTTWRVVFNGTARESTGTSISFGSYPNGTYAYAIRSVGAWYVLVGASSSVTIKGAAATVSAPYSYTSAVTFSQTGIPLGKAWTVTATLTSTGSAPVAAGQSWTATSSGRTATLYLANGSYTWTITSARYTSPSGSLSVSGAPVTVTAAPRAVFTVTFAEVGLAGGTSWNVTFNGTLYSSTKGSISITGLLNGTYSYTVGSVSGYTVSPTSGSVAVSGSPASATLTFSKVTTSSSSSTWVWIVIAVVIIVVVIALVYVFVIRKKPAATTTAPSSGSGGTASTASTGGSSAPPSSGGSSSTPPPSGGSS